MTQLRILRKRVSHVVQPAVGKTPALYQHVVTDVLQYRPAHIRTCHILGSASLVYGTDWVDVPIVEQNGDG